MNAPILPAIQRLNKLFLSGPFGSGKTTLAIQRVQWLLQQERIRGDDVIVLTPQRTLAQPYHRALRSAATPPGAPPLVTTIASLIRQSVELYWPLLSQSAGFADPGREPTFLTLETSQYHMGRFVDEAMDRGEFDGIRADRNRVISQVLDNMNKAALNQFSLDQAYTRLELAVPQGEQRTARLNALRAAQGISLRFRELCLTETLLDFSLQVTLFNQHVLTNEWSRTHLFRSHRHLIFDNLEEDTVTAHRLLRLWLPVLDSALLISDTDGGYRTFLGADPAGAEELAHLCDERQQLDASYVMTAAIGALASRVDKAVVRRVQTIRTPHTDDMSPTAFPQEHTGATEIAPENEADPAAGHDDPLAALHLPDGTFRFYPQMIKWVAEKVRQQVVDEGTEPGRIALLAPFVSDALRFSLEQALREHGIALTTHRPSRALEDEPAARSLITLAQLAHPDWELRPAPEDVTLALTLTIDGLDPVRAGLLSQIVYPPRRRTIELGRFGGLVADAQARITYALGERYDQLVDWVMTYRSSGQIAPLDQFIARIFGELLSQPGFGFHADHNAARVANQMVESARKFRWALESSPAVTSTPAALPALLGREYVKLFEDGALSALYVPGWQEPADAVFLAPAYTFLMRNRAVDVQFWLDIGASGWWERLYQPLTHPFLLSTRWSEHELWTDYHEYTYRQETMRRLLIGLLRRTGREVFLGISDYSESGYEQQGPLLNLINRILVQERIGMERG